MQYDKDFLVQLDRQRNKTIYARITKLTFEEFPLERVEGLVTGGTINIDGTSALRRTCSLTMLAQGTQQVDFYCGLNTKFKLEIGVKNTVDLNTYPEIVWFNQGVYIITSFTNSHSANNYTISISGKDKMCLLNGEVGGNLESAVDFGVVEEQDLYGNWIVRKIPIKEIIRNVVHIYGKEPFHNIIVNDLEDYGVELLEYRYDTPLYLFREKDENNSLTPYETISFKGEDKCKIEGSSTNIKKLSELDNSVLENLATLTKDIKKYIVMKNDSTNTKMYVTKINYGETCGYRLTDLTFAGDLVANAGETLTSILDKIKNMLVNFEYFYNVEGQFVFQKKPSVISVMQNLDPTKENKISANLIFNDNIYTFNGGEGISTINNNPNILNLKNDYTIWGERTSASGAKIPIHLRYAIDEKPFKYTTIKVEDNEVEDYNKKYNTELSGQEPITYIANSFWAKDGTTEYCDWREVLYRMACDYYKYNFLEDFHVKVADENPDLFTGSTGYENYYVDIFSFWRQLYFPIDEEISLLNSKKTSVGNLLHTKTERAKELESTIKRCRKTIKEKSSNKSGDEYKKAKTQLANAEKELGIIESQIKYLTEKKDDIIKTIDNLILEKENFYTPTDKKDNMENKDPKVHWNKNIFEAPYLLNFWFDFLDTDGMLSYYNTKKIGNRTKVIKDSQVKAISYNKVPNIIYHKKLDNQIEKAGYGHIQIGSQYDSMFSISAQSKSATERLSELMDIHSFCAETVTITAAPIYYLEPNSRIVVSDRDSDVADVYSVNKITLPLAHNGTMSISAAKIYDSLVQ